MIWALLSLGLPAIAGVAVVRWADSTDSPDLASVALWLGVGLPLGAGLAGALAWIWIVAGGELDGWHGAAETLALTAATVAALRSRGVSNAASWMRPPRIDLTAAIAVAVGVAIAATAFGTWTSKVPHGDWDAWAIWNLHARFLERGGAAWRLLFAPELSFSHNEYPLLLPAIVARTVAHLGGSAGPAAVAALFTLAPPLALFGAVARRAGSIPAAIASLLLLATPEWITSGLAQNADVPLAGFVLAAAACAAVAGRGPPTRSYAWLKLSGGALGMAALTKDEGIVYLVGFTAWALFRAGRARTLESAAALVAGFACPGLLGAHFRAVLSPGFASDMTRGQDFALVFARLTDLQRWAQIHSEVWSHLPGITLGLPAVAVAVAWLLGARPRSLLRSDTLLPTLAGYVAYLAAYSVSATAPDAARLSWHIATSAGRVLLHPWPALLLALFAAIPPPAATGSSDEPPVG